MKKRTGKTKKRPPETEWERFERGLKELKPKLEKLPADRVEQLKRELEEGKEH
jgi:hypothetical protein